MNIQRTNAGQGLGIAGLIIGIVSLIIAFIPCVGVFAFFPALISIILSAVGLSQASRSNGARGLTLSALIISALALGLSLVWPLFFAKLAKDSGDLKEVIEEVINNEEFQEGFRDALEDVENELDEVDIDVRVNVDDDEDFREESNKELELKLEELEKDTVKNE